MAISLGGNGSSTAPTTGGVNFVDPKYLAKQDDTRLAGLFQPIYDNAKSTLDANLSDQLKKLRGNQAARGVLQSGVADIPVTELMKANTNALGGVQSNLANIFGNTEASRSLFNTQSDFEKMMADKGFGYSSALAEQIANANKPSQFQQIMGGIGQGASTVGALASLF